LGLHEIVANFISRLISLFERPVRVGDVVTIGGATGTVSRIQIRATTIRNWDQQELLVPNKPFITGDLLNWSLTDAINRVVITVGVAREDQHLRRIQPSERAQTAIPEGGESSPSGVAFAAPKLICTEPARASG
jgi:small-conductance mechanosensitive channel